MLMAVSLLTVSSANLVPRMAQGPMCLTVLRAHRSQPAQAKNESAKADFVNFVAAVSTARELADKTFACVHTFGRTTLTKLTGQRTIDSRKTKAEWQRKFSSSMIRKNYARFWSNICPRKALP